MNVISFISGFTRRLNFCIRMSWRSCRFLSVRVKRVWWNDVYSVLHMNKISFSLWKTVLKIRMVLNALSQLCLLFVQCRFCYDRHTFQNFHDCKTRCDVRVVSVWQNIHENSHKDKIVTLKQKSVIVQFVKFFDFHDNRHLWCPNEPISLSNYSAIHSTSIARSALFLWQIVNNLDDSVLWTLPLHQNHHDPFCGIDKRHILSICLETLSSYSMPFDMSCEYNTVKEFDCRYQFFGEIQLLRPCMRVCGRIGGLDLLSSSIRSVYMIDRDFELLIF